MSPARYVVLRPGQVFLQSLLREKRVAVSEWLVRGSDTTPEIALHESADSPDSGVR